ncbi:MerR family transcriptional regulator [Kitasatospora atroaurantiaca]|uniref:DNA-binding transcriptional MerR regulator n=1 Tax=Kitasatospora atroaurantiaca TaxID=285545 RepID=A0A561EY45_9ACTN|nr:MerR family transcriptional regulator [Kitasatospora atroaurantiaca]TWE20528.1 DNA-binding transcriptional MerR regulator [Kitasatospora atroaurantiaca]
MDSDTRYSIGDLARRTGLTVKAIRFYSDRGIVPPTDRSPAGYRLYDIDAVTRLDLVRTLRDLGLDLPTIRKVVDREISLSEVAAAHAEALTVQIRTLRLRRAVLTAVAKRGSTPEETDLMHKLAKLSEDERRRLIDDFLDAAFCGLDAHPEFAAVMRSMTPELPDNPEAEQVEAWVELAELSQDPDLRAGVRRTAEHHAADRAEGATAGLRRDQAAMVRDQAGPALAAGIDPASPEADPVVAAVAAQYAHALGRPDDVDLRHRMLTRLESANDPRRERYFQLLAVINGWPAPERLEPVLDWFIRALRPRMPDGCREADSARPRITATGG